MARRRRGQAAQHRRGPRAALRRRRRCRMVAGLSGRLRRPSGAACANGAVDMEHGRRELKMLDGAAPCRRPLRGPWPTAHPYVSAFGEISVEFRQILANI